MSDQWGWYSVRDGALDMVEPCKSPRRFIDGFRYQGDGVNLIRAASAEDVKAMIKLLGAKSHSSLNSDLIEAIRAIYRYRVARGEAPPVEVQDGD